MNRSSTLKVLLACILTLSLFTVFLPNDATAKGNNELAQIKKLAKIGKTIPTKSLKLGDGGNKIKPILGKADDVSQYRTSVYVWYKKKNKSQIELLLNNPKKPTKIALIKENKLEVISVDFVNRKSYSYAQIKKVFGKPYRVWVDNRYCDYQIWYNVDGKNVIFSDSSKTYDPNKEYKVKNTMKFQGYTLNGFGK